MAILTQTPITNAQYNKAWRKVQGPVAEGLNFKVEELKWISACKDASFDWSLREVTAPVDIYRVGGVASIDEGAKEALPVSANFEEISVAPVFFNRRFEASRFVEYIDQYGGDTQIEKQLKVEASQAIRSMGAHIGDYFHGSSTGVLAITDTDVPAAASATFTLKNAYARADIAGTTPATAKFLSNLFVVNSDRVAILNAGTLVAIGLVTAANAATPSITVTFDTTPSAVTTDGLQIVKANSIDSSKTDFNRGLVGMVDGMFATSLHGISSSIVLDWSLAGTDVAGGRFSGIRLHKAKDEIQNYGDAEAKITTIMAQDVYRDQVSLYQASYRFQDPFAIEIDGDLKGGEKMFRKSRRVPSGYVYVGDFSGLQKWMLLPGTPDSATSKTVRWADGRRREDSASTVFNIDVPMQMIWRNRKKFYAFTGLTGQ